MERYQEASGMEHVGVQRRARSPDADVPLPVEGDPIMFHPLFTETVMLRTPSIDEVFLVVKRAVLLRETGCVFQGESGIGKSFAVDMVQAMLLRQYPRLCVFTHDAHNHEIPSIRAFFKHFLKSVGQKKEQKGETYDLRTRLVNILVDQARISGTNLIVLFIDEANAMLLSDFLFLKDVFNDLVREGVQMVTILMGQSPELLHVIDMLRTEGRNDLVGRFAMRVHAIRGYNSLSDFQAILGGIDRCQYPIGSEISWTAFFVPIAWRQGFRLEQEAQRCLAAMRAACKDASKLAEFPARQVFLAVRSFLVALSGIDGAAMKVPEQAWSDAVRYALIQDAVARMKASSK
ncbi:ATP-binding protein [Collimonas humicola]|uniref:ATP-binding protein n=1 Tax=Collimonas humicola TaxID=2825886 RepID=UPI001B8BF3A1|nr:ATP-binding protein [Collimonas humicola]